MSNGILTPPVGPADHAQGDPDALVEYGDYECPHCGRAHGIVKRVQRVYEARVRADFRSGTRSGVNGTPTFFVNGRRYEGDWTDPGVFAAALQQLARPRAHR